MEQQDLIIRLDSAKREFVQCANDIMQKYGLSCYLTEPILAELYAQIKATAQGELAQARAQMKSANADNTK